MDSKIIEQDFSKYKFARHMLLLIYAYKRLGSKRFLAAETLYVLFSLATLPR